ncbi:MAG: hypothetical protein CMR00_12765 [[Chlorobium] sp. 445]|nr:MAG: hypothetical protein CMR00_12765 [[Chlorobium] sp. 445]
MTQDSDVYFNLLLQRLNLLNRFNTNAQNLVFYFQIKLISLCRRFVAVRCLTKIARSNRES